MKGKIPRQYPTKVKQSQRSDTRTLWLWKGSQGFGGREDGLVIRGVSA